MKKSLIALAVLGAVAGSAAAQSAVTVYGVADVAVTKLEGQSTQMSSSSGMNNGTSRLGFRGTEDLGGGLKASFNFEQGLNLEQGAATGVNIAGGAANLFDRQANMALSGDWGTLSLGRMLSTGYFAQAAYELTGTANYSIVGGQFGGFTGGTRNNSEFRYTTPNFNGFTAAIGYITDTDNATTDAEIGLNLIYKGGPIAAGLAYTRLGDEVNGGDADYSLGAAYNFGAFKVAASYADHDSANAKGYTLGGSTTLGPVSLVLDAARRTTDGFENTDYLLEAKYNLSKRTTVYGAYVREGLGDANNYSVGVRHNF
jgi:predicted porin